jgi:hypothetical protein
MAFNRRPQTQRIVSQTRVQPRTTELELDKQEGRLEQSVEDAELLVNHAGRQGIRVEKPILDAIAHARELLEQGKLTGTQEADFYSNFVALSRAVAPVTVTSLKSCVIEREFPNWFSRHFAKTAVPKWISHLFERQRKETYADRVLRFYRGLDFVVLIILVLVQGYWVIGSYLLANIPAMSEDKTQREQGIKQEAQWVFQEKLAHLDPAPTPTLSPSAIEDAQVKKEHRSHDRNANSCACRVASILGTISPANCV